MAATRRSFLKLGGAVGAAVGTGFWPTIASSQDVLKVGIVLSTPPTEIGWTKTHTMGAEALERELGDRVKVTQIMNIENPQEAERVFRELASSGHKLVVGTSFSHGAPLQRVASRFPDTAFLHCSGLVTAKNVATFDAKYYEGCFIAGAAAGYVTKSNKIGFIGGLPTPVTLSSANAFLLGAQSVKPEVTCNVIFLSSWYDPSKEKEGTYALMSQGIDVIQPQTDTAAGVQAAGEKGAWSVGYGTDFSKFANGRQLTAYLLDWSGPLVDNARAVLDGTWVSTARWDGLPTVVKMSPYNEEIPADAREKLKQLEADIIAKTVHPFAGEIKDKDGNVKVAKGEVMADADIRSMNWLTAGMIGNTG